MDYIHKQSCKPAQAIKVDLSTEQTIKESLVFIGHIPDINFRPKDFTSSERFEDYIHDVSKRGVLINASCDIYVKHGEYIIKTERGKFIPCRAYIFEEEYELSLQLNIK